MATEMSLPHSLTLKDRKSLTMSGVTEVVSFDENSVVLHTELGTLSIHGRDLQLKNLTLDGGQVAVEGNVAALIYEEPRSGGFLRRLMG